MNSNSPNRPLFARVFALLLALSLLAGCIPGGVGITVTPTGTTAQTPTPFEPTPTTAATDTSEPPPATDTAPAPTNTSEPTVTPVVTPTGVKITPENVQNLQVVDETTQAGARAFTWVTENPALAVGTESAFYLYSLNPLDVIGQKEIPALMLAASADGLLLATVSDDNTIHLWDVTEGTEIEALTGHTAAISGLDFSPDGTILASAAGDNTLKFWDTSSGELSDTWDLAYWPQSVEYSPDGSQLAVVDAQTFTVHILNSADGSEVRSLAWTDHASPVLYGAFFSPDWQTLAWVARGTIQLMDPQTGDLGATLGHEDFVTDIAWSPDGSLLASSAAGTVDGNYSPVVYLWDVTAGITVHRLVMAEVALDVAFSPDGERLATLEPSGLLQIWAVAQP